MSRSSSAAACAVWAAVAAISGCGELSPRPAGRNDASGGGGRGGSAPSGPSCESQPDGRRATKIAAFGGGAFALLSDGTLWCWSDGFTFSCPWSEPRKIRGLPCIAEFDGSSSYVAAIDERGGVWVWGERSDGEIRVFPHANATWADADEPIVVWGNSVVATWWSDGYFVNPPPHEPSPFYSSPAGVVAVGPSHGCHFVGGDLFCFGFNGSGELGDGSVEADPYKIISTPVRANIDAVVVAAQPVAGSRTYALDDQGRLWAWGRPHVVDGPSEPSGPIPQVMGELPPLCGFSHNSRVGCGWTCDGDVWCWGRNAYNMLTADDESGWLVPARMPDLEPSAQISIGGGSPLCSRRMDGSVVCRGYRGRPSGALPLDWSATTAEFVEEEP